MALRGWQDCKETIVVLPVKRESEWILSEVGRYQFSSQFYRKQLFFETNAHRRVGVGHLIACCSCTSFSPLVFPVQPVDQSSWGVCGCGCTAFSPVSTAGLRSFCSLWAVCALMLVLMLRMLRALGGGVSCGGPKPVSFKPGPNTALQTVGYVLTLLLLYLWGIRWNLGSQFPNYFLKSGQGWTLSRFFAVSYKIFQDSFEINLPYHNWQIHVFSGRKSDG